MTKPKLKVLRTHKVRAQEGVVTVLTDWLSRAKQGEIIGVALAGVRVDGSTLTNYRGQSNVALLGCIERLRHRILTEEEDYD